MILGIHDYQEAGEESVPGVDLGDELLHAGGSDAAKHRDRRIGDVVLALGLRFPGSAFLVHVSIVEIHEEGSGFLHIAFCAGRKPVGEFGMVDDPGGRSFPSFHDLFRIAFRSRFVLDVIGILIGGHLHIELFDGRVIGVDLHLSGLPDSPGDRDRGAFPEAGAGSDQERVEIREKLCRPEEVLHVDVVPQGGSSQGHD